MFAASLYTTTQQITYCSGISPNQSEFSFESSQLTIEHRELSLEI